MFKNNFKKRSVIIFSVGLVSLVALVFLMNSFSPDQFVPVGTLVVFFLIYLVCYVIFYILYSTLLGVANVVNLRKSTDIAYKQLLYLAIISMAPVVLLALQSINGIGLIEITLIIIATFLVCFYISRQ